MAKADICGKRMDAGALRKAFVEFFVARGHLERKSASLVPIDDKSLLFNSAGMVPFKKYFSGELKPPSKRIVSVQKCFRTTDWDLIGDASHLTFFEMLGNFSFGDYFKKEACAWALELMTATLGFNAERLFYTVHTSDDEAFEVWRELGIAESKIYRLGDEHNWWGPAGREGPCGPCSEIHVYTGSDDIGALEGEQISKRIADGDGFLEVYNLVFTQFDRQADGSDTPLKNKNIDTGMGLERVLTLMNGVESPYDASPLLATTKQIKAEINDATDFDAEGETRAVRIIADHTRAAVMLIGDGVRPSSAGKREDVLRRLILKAAFYANELEMRDGALADIAQTVVDEMQGEYSELAANAKTILSAISEQQTRFNESFQQNWQRFKSEVQDYLVINDFLAAGDKKVDLGDYSGALKEYEKALKVKPAEQWSNKDSSKVLTSLGYLHEKRGEWNEAIQCFARAIDLDENNATAHVLKGIYQHDLDRYTAAIADCDKAIANNSKEDRAYNVRGHSKYMLGHYKAALADFDKAIEINPHNALAYCHRGDVEIALKRYDEALSDCEKALKLDQSKDIKEMCDDIKNFLIATEAIKKNPEDVAAYCNRISYYEAASRRQYELTYDDCEEVERKGFRVGHLTRYTWKRLKECDEIIRENPDVSKKILAYQERVAWNFEWHRYERARLDLEVLRGYGYSTSETGVWVKEKLCLFEEALEDARELWQEHLQSLRQACSKYPDSALEDAINLIERPGGRDIDDEVIECYFANSDYFDLHDAIVDYSNDEEERSLHDRIRELYYREDSGFDAFSGRVVKNESVQDNVKSGKNEHSERQPSSPAFDVDKPAEETRISLPGKKAAQLYETLGRIVFEIFTQESGLPINEEEFKAELEKIREQSRGAAKFGDTANLQRLYAELAPTEFIGDENESADGTLEARVSIRAIFKADGGQGASLTEARKADGEVMVALDKTPFYAERGGQVGDTGWLEGDKTAGARDNRLAEVANTQSPYAGISAHTVKVVKGKLKVGDYINARVDGERRQKIMRNHTATHLIHAALRQKFGEQLKQAGSLVHPDYLRFDFNHDQPLTAEEIFELQDIVNGRIRDNQAVAVEYADYDKAVRDGALAFFGERYEAGEVRTIKIDAPWSYELCGGTHMAGTGGIGAFVIVSQSGIGAGLRRIFAVTGVAAEKQMQAIQKLALRLDAPLDRLGEQFERALKERDAAQKELDKYQRLYLALLRSGAEADGASAAEGEDLTYALSPEREIAVKIMRPQAPNVDMLRKFGDSVMAKLRANGVLIAAAVIDEQPKLVTMVTKDLNAVNVRAGDIAKSLARKMGGGGGGSASTGQGGGKSEADLNAALTAESVKRTLDELYGG